MKYALLMTFAFIGATALADSNYEGGQERPQYVCSLQNGYFRVANQAGQKWEHYTGNSDSSKDAVACNHSQPSAVSGSYFVRFNGQNFESKYIGTPAARPLIKASKHLVAAFFDSYLVYAGDQGPIQQKYISSNSNQQLAVGSRVIIASSGSYLYGADENRFVEKYVSSTSDSDTVVAAGAVAAARKGNYLLVFHDGQWFEKYVSTPDNDGLVAGRNGLVAAAAGSYFMVFDPTAATFRENYVGSRGKVQIRGETASFTTESGTIRIYDSVSGTFK